MGHLRRDDRRSTRALALHAVLPSWIILRLGCRDVRGHSPDPARERSTVPSSARDAINDNAFATDRQDRDRDDISLDIRHPFRLAWHPAANLLTNAYFVAS